MSLSPLDILNEDPLNLFGNERKEKAKKKKGRRHRRDIFAELGLDDDKETEGSLLEGISFLKTKPASPIKSVTFKDAIVVKEISHSEQVSSNYSADKESIDECNQSVIELEQAKRPLGDVGQNPLASQEFTSAYQETLSDSKERKGITDYRKAEMNSATQLNPKPFELEFGLGDRTSARYSEQEQGENIKDDKSPDTAERALESKPKTAVPHKDLEHLQQENVQRNTGDVQPVDLAQTASSAAVPTVRKSCVKETAAQPETARPEKVSPVESLTATARVTRSNSLSLPTPILKHADKQTSEPGVGPRSKVSIADKNNQHVRTLPTSKSSPRRPSSCHLGRSIEVPKDGANDAASMRMLVYREWYLKSQKSILEARRVMSEREAKEAERKLEAFEKAQESDKMFMAWKSRKRAYFREQLKKKREEEAVRQKKVQETNERKASSEKAFEVWKSRKDAVLLKQAREKQEKQKLFKETKQTEEKEKRTQAEKAFQAWRTKKEAELRELLHNQRQEQAHLEKRKEEEMKQKSEKAAEAYYQWELKKIASLGAMITGHGFNQANSMENLRPTVTSGRMTERAPWRPASGRSSMTRGLPS
ncbi:hypothetical protein CRM22_002562 [Opisthorchis felineus]|uniref:Microtubule-associated protein 9 n=1 Tax=Opisthorchis felineus TaxID=147828 RepID=A0A4S2M5Z3_OPIFE|nr:hypothetical protein CRM22_002562 [Opisthorchis felineus]